MPPPTSPRPPLDRAVATVACARAAAATFNRQNWMELGALCGRGDVVEEHPRLLRSLRFNDDDYGNAAFEVMRTLLGSDLERFDVVDRYIGLRSWLSQHDQPMHDILYEPLTEVSLPAADLSSLRDPSAIEAQLQRIRRSLDDDFELAIGAAKELVEATAKTVLRQLEVAFVESADLPELARAVQRELRLHPDVLAPTSAGADSVRRILGALATLPTAIAELRNLYGTGHGRASAVQLKRRHAELAVDASILYCKTLLATLADPDAPWRISSNRPHR